MISNKTVNNSIKNDRKLQNMIKIPTKKIYSHQINISTVSIIDKINNAD